MTEINNKIVIIIIVFAFSLFTIIDSLYDVFMGLNITDSLYYDKNGLEHKKTRIKTGVYLVFAIITFIISFIIRGNGKRFSLYYSISLIMFIIFLIMSLFLSSFSFEKMEKLKKKYIRLIISSIVLCILLTMIIYIQENKQII